MLLPFFTYYGGKWRVAPKYPAPQHDLLMEPFAGSAGYSLRHPERQVWINDIDPRIAGTWEYLVNVQADEILSLPDLGEGDTVEDFGLCQEAQWLIGWWLNKGSLRPKKRPSSFMLNHSRGAPYWGEGIRQRIAGQLDAIRHWKVTCLDYKEIDAGEATWFIDPPYRAEGLEYRYGSKKLDYEHLASWCRERTGLVMVCESGDADWLPFQPFTKMQGTAGKQKANPARQEVLWVAMTRGTASD